MIPAALREALAPITVIVGHYGAGKTNFSLNLALQLKESYQGVSLIDLDIVNPYFRATEQRSLLEEYGINLVSPIFSESGSSLDVPSLTGRIEPVIQAACHSHIVIVDAGGDDAGATVLGRFAPQIRMRNYAMFYVANRFRNLVQNPYEAVKNLREIELASHLRVSAIVNNSHLKDVTTPDDIVKGRAYALELASCVQLPLVCTTAAVNLNDLDIDELYPVQNLMKNPWE